MRHILIVIVLFSFHALYSQKTNINLKNVFLLSDHSRLYKKIGHSSYPANQLSLNYNYKDDLNVSASTIMDFVFPLVYSDKFYNNPTNQVALRLYIDSLRRKLYKVDEDFNASFVDEKVHSINGSTDTLKLYFNGHKHFYQIQISEILENRIYDVKDLQVTPLNYYQGSVQRDDINHNLIVSDDILGTYIYMDKMFNDDNDTINRVKLHQPFKLSDGRIYSFNSFDIRSLTITLQEMDAGHLMEGSNVGYFIDTEKLQDLLDLDSLTDITIFYFWGVWCKPCIDNLNNSISYYHK